MICPRASITAERLAEEQKRVRERGFQDMAIEDRSLGIGCISVRAPTGQRDDANPLLPIARAEVVHTPRSRRYPGG